GDQQVYPRSITRSHMGITYRQYMAGQIAGHLMLGQIIACAIKGDDLETSAERIDGVAHAIWHYTDMILDAEIAFDQPEQHEA
ncbi:MAG: hypothetical protein V3V08_13080, partial [Nannocystaceae bacterium]